MEVSCTDNVTLENTFFVVATFANRFFLDRIKNLWCLCDSSLAKFELVFVLTFENAFS